MSEAFGLKLDDEETKKRLSIKPLTLPKVFEMGLQVLSAAGPPLRGSQAAAGQSPGVAQESHQSAPESVAKQKEGAAAGAPHRSSTPSQGAVTGDDARLLDKFVATLKSRGFFEGLTEGTPAWWVVLFMIALPPSSLLRV